MICFPKKNSCLLLPDELKKKWKADPIQNPEIVSNLKENRTLHDVIDYTGHTSAFQQKLEQWENCESLYILILDQSYDSCCIYTLQAT